MGESNKPAFPVTMTDIWIDSTNTKDCDGLTKREYISAKVLASKNARNCEFDVSIAVKESIRQADALLSALSETAHSVDREPLKEVTGREKEIRDCNYKDDNAKPGSFDSEAWRCASIAYLLGLLDSERKKSVNQEMYKTLIGVREYLKSWGDQSLEQHEPERHAYESICNAITRAEKAGAK